MRHLFLPYYLAVIAKEKGFDELCLAAYIKQELRGCGAILFDVDGLYNNYGTGNEEQHWIAAPLYQQIVDWFREKHGIIITITYIQWSHLGEEAYTPHIEGSLEHKDSTENHYMRMMWENYPTHSEALNKAIEEAFKLIN